VHNIIFQILSRRTKT